MTTLEISPGRTSNQQAHMAQGSNVETCLHTQQTLSLLDDAQRKSTVCCAVISLPTHAGPFSTKPNFLVSSLCASVFMQPCEKENKKSACQTH